MKKLVFFIVSLLLFSCIQKRTPTDIVLPWINLTISHIKAYNSQPFLALFSIIEGATSWVQIFQRHCTIRTQAVPHCRKIGLSVRRQYKIAMGDCIKCPQAVQYCCEIVLSVHKWYNIATRLYQVSTSSTILRRDCVKCPQVVQYCGSHCTICAQVEQHCGKMVLPVHK